MIPDRANIAIGIGARSLAGRTDQLCLIDVIEISRNAFVQLLDKRLSIRILPVHGSPSQRRRSAIRTSEKLLEAAQSPKLRKDLAEKLEVSEQDVLRWANLTDRMRIKGVREPYAELLKDAGVDTVRELGHRNTAKLVERMKEANAKNKRVRLLPSEKRVERWIAAAKRLEPKIRY